MILPNNPRLGASIPLNPVVRYVSAILGLQAAHDKALRNYEVQFYMDQFVAGKSPTTISPLDPLFTVSPNLYPILLDRKVVASFKFGIHGYCLAITVDDDIRRLLAASQRIVDKFASFGPGYSLLSRPFFLADGRLLVPVVSATAVTALTKELESEVNTTDLQASALFYDSPSYAQWSLREFPPLVPGVTIILGPWGSGKSTLARAIGEKALAFLSYSEPEYNVAGGEYTAITSTSLLSFILQAFALRISGDNTTLSESEQRLLATPILVVDSISKHIYATDDAAGTGGISPTTLASLGDLNNVCHRLGLCVVLVVNPDTTGADTKKLDALNAAAAGKVSTTIRVEAYDNYSNTVRFYITSRANQYEGVGRTQVPQTLNLSVLTNRALDPHQNILNNDLMKPTSLHNFQTNH